MSRTSLREELQQARASAAAGDTEAAVRTLDRALQELGPERLLTPEEAAQHLGISSFGIVEYWIRSGYLQGESRDGQVLVPLSEVERIHDSDRVRAIRAADILHDLSADLGDDAGMSDEDMQILSESRPGTLPWKRK